MAGRRRGRPPETEITDAQRRALDEVRDFIAERGFPPTMSELAERLGVTPASAHQFVLQLERKGYLSREPRKARSLSIVREPRSTPAALVPVPLLGVVKAGLPMFAEENRLGEVLVDAGVAARGPCFALTVSGDSMIDAGIRDGDLVIVRRQTVAESGEIVVALLGDEATVKRLVIRGDRIELRAENRRYKPIPVAGDSDFQVLGKVIAIRHPVER